MYACSSGNRLPCVTVVEWKQLIMAFTAQSMLHATEAQVIYFLTASNQGSLRYIKAWDQAFIAVLKIAVQFCEYQENCYRYKLLT